MINQQLIDYIKQQMQQGVSLDNIKNTLRSNGWGDADIDQAFNNLATPLSGAPSVPADQIFRPKGVKVISVLYFLGSLLALGFGVSSLFGANLFTQILGAGFFGKLFVIGGIIFIVLGVLGISVGIGLWKYKSWSRWITVFLSLAGIIMALTFILKGNIASNIFNVIINSIIGGYLFFSPKVKVAFEPKKGLVPLNKKLLLTSIILLFLIIGLASAFGLQTAPSTTTNQPSPIVPVPVTPTPPPATTGEKPQVLTPKESYLKMKAEADNIETYAELEAFILKYGTKNRIAELKPELEKVSTLPPSAQEQMVTDWKSLSPSSTEITTIQEIINGNTATLNVQSTKPGLIGTVTLVLEDNQWKLWLEDWKQK